MYRQIEDQCLWDDPKLIQTRFLPSFYLPEEDLHTFVHFSIMKL